VPLNLNETIPALVTTKEVLECPFTYEFNEVVNDIEQMN